MVFNVNHTPQHFGQHAGVISVSFHFRHRFLNTCVEHGLLSLAWRRVEEPMRDGCDAVIHSPSKDLSFEPHCEELFAIRTFQVQTQQITPERYYAGWIPQDFPAVGAVGSHVSSTRYRFRR